MNIITVKPLYFPEVKVIRYGRFPDKRGYFTEHFRLSDMVKLDFLSPFRFVQCNESYSIPNTIRGLHFQWSPYQGKLVRTIFGRMVDLILDIRIGSPTAGKIIAYDMPARHDEDFGEWIWIPPGFAHGNFYTEHSKIEYFCTGEYNPQCEAGISPLSVDIDWSCCDESLKREFDEIVRRGPVISDKDRNGYSFEAWLRNENANNFIYGKV